MATTGSNTPEGTITLINEAKRQRLPLDLELTPESISRWLRHCTIPRNHVCVTVFLSRCGLSVNRLMDELSVKALLHYNLSTKRRRAIERQMQKRTRLLLELQSIYCVESISEKG